MQRNLQTGQQLRQWRHDERLTTAYLSDALGISRHRLWEWENKGVPACDLQLMKLAVRQLHTEKLPF